MSGDLLVMTRAHSAIYERTHNGKTAIRFGTESGALVSVSAGWHLVARNEDGEEISIIDARGQSGPFTLEVKDSE